MINLSASSCRRQVDAKIHNTCLHLRSLSEKAPGAIADEFGHIALDFLGTRKPFGQHCIDHPAHAPTHP